MRIISGDKKGLVLNSIKGDWIRPTSDKIRGALFSSLLSEFSEIDGFVDCFAGSGAISIEACSRGVKNIFLFDKNKNSIEIIKKNIKKANYQKDINVYNCSALKGLDILSKEHIKFDVFFMDPPYKDLDLIYPIIEKIYDDNLLNDKGIIVVEHDKNDIINKLINNYHIYKEKKFGNTVLTYIENE